MSQWFDRKHLYEKYYIFLYIAYIVFVFVPGMRVGVVASIITIIVFLPFASTKIDGTDACVLLLMIWGLISVLFTDLSSKSIDLYTSKYMNAFFPMLFFFIGKREEVVSGESKFYKYFEMALLLCFFIGLYWYIAEPQYYVDYLRRTTYGFYLSSYHSDKRFCSFLGSIGIGLLSVSGVIVFLSNYYKCRSRKYLIGTACMVLMCLLSMQRSAYLLTVFFIVWIVLRNSRKSPIKTVTIVGIAAIGFLMASIFMPSGDIYTQILGRITAIDIEKMIHGRISGQWASFFQNGLLSNIIGSGVGSHTQGSSQAFNDGAYINIIGEVGFLGLGLLVIIIINCIRYRKKNPQDKIVPLMIVVAFLLQGVGSNGMLYMDLAPLFWFSLGKLRQRTNCEFEVNLGE